MLRPAAVSITQATEVGTVYTPAELRALADHAHRLGLRVHVDGARLANAAAHLGCGLREMTTEVGVDVVSLGGTKNGALFAEAIVVVEPAAATGITYLRKMDTQLASKMRFLSAQLLALYDGDLWLRCARHANAMAARLAGGLAGVPGLRLAQPVQANGIFAAVPPATAEAVRRSHHFYDWGRGRDEVRLMCSWDTTDAAVDELVAAFQKAAAQPATVG